MAKSLKNLTKVEFISASYEVIDDREIWTDVKVSSKQGEFYLFVFPNLENGTMDFVEKIIDDKNNRDFYTSEDTSKRLIRKLNKQYTKWFSENISNQEWYPQVLKNRKEF